MYKVGDLVQVTRTINDGNEALKKRALFQEGEYAVISQVYYHNGGGRIKSLDGKRASQVNFYMHIQRARQTPKSVQVLYGKSNN